MSFPIDRHDSPFGDNYWQLDRLKLFEEPLLPGKTSLDEANSNWHIDIPTVKAKRKEHNYRYQFPFHKLSTSLIMEIFSYSLSVYDKDPVARMTHVSPLFRQVIHNHWIKRSIQRISTDRREIEDITYAKYFSFEWEQRRLKRLRTIHIHAATVSILAAYTAFTWLLQNVSQTCLESGSCTNEEWISKWRSIRFWGLYNAASNFALITYIFWDSQIHPLGGRRDFLIQDLLSACLRSIHIQKLIAIPRMLKVSAFSMGMIEAIDGVIRAKKVDEMESLSQTAIISGSLLAIEGAITPTEMTSCCIKTSRKVRSLCERISAYLKGAFRKL